MRRATTEIRQVEVVASCVRSPQARDIVAAVVQQCGCDSVVVSGERLLTTLRDGGPWAALIHDLGPWDGAGTAQVFRARHTHPDLPILLYVPPIPGIADALLRCGAIPCVRADLQQRASAMEVERLRPMLAALLAARPHARMLAMVRAIIPAAPHRVWQFVELAVARLGDGKGPVELRIEVLARELGASERTLERAWRDASLPGPKELLGWLALLLVTVEADLRGASSAATARCLRIDSRQLYRLRRRLLALGEGEHARYPEHECNVILAAFAERCREIRVARTDSVVPAATA